MDFDKLISAYLSCDTLSEKQEQTKKFIEELKRRTVIIYGAGVTGKQLLRSLRMHGLEPLYMVDRRWQEYGFVDGCKTCAPKELAEVNDVRTVVVMAINALIIRQSDHEPYENIRRYAPQAAVIGSGTCVNEMLRFAHCFERLQNAEALCLADCLNCGAESSESELCGVYQEYLHQLAPSREVLADHPSKKFDWFGYIMGQHCSLRCKNCCEHVPYFTKPVFSDSETILSDCRKISESCAFIRYIELVGGEPFLHPQLEQVLKGLLSIPNVGYIKIFTNGTIVPKAPVIELLKGPRVMLHISNYTDQAQGQQLENIRQLMRMLQEQHIHYVYGDGKEWTDWGDFHDRGLSDEVLADHAAHCFIYNCHRVFQGRLYHCPHQYAGIQLGEMRLTEGEYVELNAWNAEELAQKLDDFESLPFTDGCRRCDMPFDCPIVPAGIQLGRNTV